MSANPPTDRMHMGDKAEAHDDALVLVGDPVCGLVEGVRHLQGQLAEARALLSEVANSGHADIDSRIDWIEVQVDREVWQALQAYKGRQG